MTSASAKPKRGRPVLDRQPVKAGEAYTLPAFAARTGLGRWALTACRRDGLRVIRAGGRAFVLGSDWISYLESKATEAP
jgi:hypothetical protein